MYYTKDEACKKLCLHAITIADKHFSSRCKPTECMAWMQLGISSQGKGFCAFNIEAIKLLENMKDNGKDT